MTLENQLINKSYYESLINKDDNIHPVEALGKMYVGEQKKDIPDLSNIRFAQGEVYFHNKDYETAIFKWENINNELEPWAKKNMADSYFELDILTTAEEIYKSIKTDNLTLNTEVSLQLFLLYIEQGRQDMAVEVMKGVLSSNPDYPNVTSIARVFFEEHELWNHAVELAVSEAMRNESLEWFGYLRTYVEKELPKDYAPSFFHSALKTLYTLDQIRFKQLVSSLWKMYSNNLEWLHALNELIHQLEINDLDSWEELTVLYEESYTELTNGQYLISELAEIVPNTLSNWLKISNFEDSILPSSAILAWNDLFPSSLSSSLVLEAKERFSKCKNSLSGNEEMVRLYETINEWSKKQDIEIESKFKWIANELLENSIPHLLIAGVSDANKRPFINAALRNEIGNNNVPSVVIFNENPVRNIDIVTDQGIAAISELSAFKAIEEEVNPYETIIDYKLPSEFLKETKLSFIDTPGLNRSSALFNFLYLADSILFVLDANDPFHDAERDILLQIKKVSPNIQMDFLVYDVDYDKMLSILSRVNIYFPKGKVYTFQTNEDSKPQLKKLIENIFYKHDVEKGRTKKLMYHLQKRIKTLTNNRFEMEQNLIQSIQWNQEMAAKLNGAVNQVGDLEKEQAKNIKNAFIRVHKEIRDELISTIPSILRSCSDMVKETSDFGKIHIEINEEMNKRIQDYLNQTISPKFLQSIGEWIAFSEKEFTNSKLFLEEMIEGFNALYGKQRISFACDFKVLEDWRRDAARLTSRMSLDKIDIMLRFNPAQFLLKSAGKLLGSITQNKTILYNKYKKFVENENYEEEAMSIAKKFLEPFEMFEKGIESDVTMFFKNPLQVMKETIEQTHVEIKNNEETLNKMKTKPETFLDPLTLFGLRLRQFERVLNKENELYQTYSS